MLEEARSFPSSEHTLTQKCSFRFKRIRKVKEVEKMSLFSGKVIAGKYEGSMIAHYSLNHRLDMCDFDAHKGLEKDVESVQLLSNKMKANFFSIIPVKEYYQVQVRWKSGGESIMEVDKDIFALIMRNQMK